MSRLLTTRSASGQGRHVLGVAILLASVVAAPAGRPVAMESGSSPSSSAPVSFRNDVMAVLSRAGCNMGVCHGNKNGKGGFKLSLRGQDPASDLVALTRDVFARRVCRTDPDRSLVLLKPTASVPHEGGQRFSGDSEEYEILRRWIARGALDDPPGTPRLLRLEVSPREAVVASPRDRVQIHVAAHFSGGVSRDVRELAVYEPSQPLVEVGPDGLVVRRAHGEVTVLVRYLDQKEAIRLAFIPARRDYHAGEFRARNLVDLHVLAKLRRLRLNPSNLCEDRVFLRRAYLDLLGLIPTAEEARRFLADSRPDRRARLVDELLQRPEFAEHWALRWSDLLRNEEKVLDRRGVKVFHEWIRDAIAQGRPLDAFAADLVRARGSTYDHPPANYYRANRDPISRAEATAQVFLGLRLQCAKCHDHPFDRWTQDDYYGWTALFARVEYRIVENKRRDKNDKHEFVGEQIVLVEEQGEVENPRTGEPAPPAFLGGGEPDLAAGGDRLEALAEWIESPENPFFARAQVNRTWYHLVGRGLVEPVDDFRATNPASHPALLEALTRDFVEHGLDLRHLIRTIMASRAYQVTSLPRDGSVEDNRDAVANYAHTPARRLGAEALLDALARALDVPVVFNGYRPGIRAGQIPGVRAVRPRDETPSAGDRFLTLFGKPPRLLTCECERSDETTLNQAFQLISGPLLNDLLTRPDNRLSRLLATGRSDREIVEELWWSALGREPAAAEVGACLACLQNASDRRAALEDVAWSLLNSKEFLLRH